MVDEGQSSQSRGQGAFAAQELNLQMPKDLKQTVKHMMQQMELFKKDPRLLFVREETPGMAYDVPRPPPVQGEK